MEERSRGDVRPLLTIADVAARLGITAKAARRRLERGTLVGLRVVRVGRSVRVSGEDLDAWICRKGEIGGARERATRSMHVSAPAYRNDPTRRHVSIILEHPRTHATIRRRIVTPFPCEESAALVWGRQQALDLLERLMRGEEREDTAPTDTPRAKPRATPPQTPETPILAEVWDRFYALRSSRLRPGTLRVDHARWRTRIRPVLGDLRVSEIGRLEIVRMRASLATNDAHYANQCLGLLRRLLEFAVENGLIEDAPAIKAERTTRKPAEAVPEEEDLDSLVREAERMTARGRYPGSDLALMVLLGLDAGLRPGEVAGLRWCDVDLRRKCIIIRNTRAAPGNSDLPPKANDAGTVYLTDRLAARLAAEQRRVGGRGTAYVFHGQDGPLYTVLVSKRIADVHEAAGLPIHHAHWLRHCAASRAISEGATLEQTSAHLRHSDLQVTQRYVHKIMGRDPGPAAAAVLNRRAAARDKDVAKSGT